MAIYYVQLVDVLEAAGVRCKVEDVNRGWETRARSSGGFSSAPLGIIDHHTASNTTPYNDLMYMIHNCPDAPVGNMYLDNEGVVWPIAAGASNCAGKGGPYTFSRGTVPLDSGNSRCWNIEAANSGVGEVWTQAQIDAYFKINIALSKMFGNKVTDVASHQEWAPDRKIDPATAAAVQGPWKPRSINSSGTWNMDDMRSELVRRADDDTTPPEPTPTPTGDDNMLFLMKAKDTSDIYLGDGNTCSLLSPEAFDAIGDLMDQGFTRWHHPHRSGWPLIKDRTEVAEMAKARLVGVMGKQT